MWAKYFTFKTENYGSVYCSHFSVGELCVLQTTTANAIMMQTDITRRKDNPTPTTILVVSSLVEHELVLVVATHICPHINTHVNTYILCTNIHTYIYTYIHKCMYTSIHMYTHTHVHPYMDTHMHTHTHTFTHTHTHIGHNSLSYMQHPCCCTKV